ncbi:MAG TPA: sulfatase [Candidatus Eisenbacteria bacterium]|nr:sulfatase [Candidatus Eisenbacteria bacterium]
MKTVVVAGLLILAAVPRMAFGGCTSSDDAQTVRKSLRQAVRCNDRKFKNQNTTCQQTVPPTCADTMVADAVRLAYGANDPPAAEIDAGALSLQYRCQKQIGKAVSSYVGKKLRYLTLGIDPALADERAARQLEKIPLKCAVTVAADASGVVIPNVGPQCAAAVGAVGTPVDTAGLQTCLHTLGRTWVDRNGPNPQPLRPNILFILSDDQRWDTTDATQAPAGELIMPGLHHELGDSGVRFTQAFMTTPLCCPSRSSILRGQYAHTTGVLSNSGPHGGAHVYPADGVSLGTMLQSAGYRTGFIGKYLNGYPALWTAGSPPFVPAGWDEWHVFEQPTYFNYTLVRNGVGYDHVEELHGAADADYSTDVLREIARDFITTSAATGEPFFLYLAPKAPHLPEEPAPRHVDKYLGIAPWRPASYNESDAELDDMPMWVQNTPLLDMGAMAALDAIRQHQLEMLQAVDEMIGGSTQFAITGLMQTLRDLGIADHTLVVYFSDNGWLWGEHRQDRKNKPFEEAIRAPMFVRYPALAPLARIESNAMTLNIDLCPTFAELAGVSLPPIQFDGRSLVRILDGTAPAWRTDFVTEGWPAQRVWATVREAQWKYTETVKSNQLPLPPIEVELYDVVADPLEQSNVAPLYPDEVARLAAKLRSPGYRPLWPSDADGTFDDPDE